MPVDKIHTSTEGELNSADIRTVCLLNFERTSFRNASSVNHNELVSKLGKVACNYERFALFWYTELISFI